MALSKKQLARFIAGDLDLALKSSDVGELYKHVSTIEDEDARLAAFQKLETLSVVMSAYSAEGSAWTDAYQSAGAPVDEQQ